MNYSNRNFESAKSAVLGVPPQKSTKWTIPYQAIAPLAMLCDALIIITAGVLSGVAYHVEFIGQYGDISQFGSFSVVVAILFTAIGKSRGYYELPALLNFKLQLHHIAKKWAGIFLFLTAIAFTMKIGNDFSRGATLSFATFGPVALIGTRIVWRFFIASGLALNKFSGRKIVLITEQAATDGPQLQHLLAKHGLQPVKHFVLPAGHSAEKRRNEIMTEAVTSIRGSNLEEIIISANPDNWPELNKLMSALRVLPLSVKLIPSGPLSELFKMSFFKIGDTLSVELQSSPRSASELLAKRLLDILIAGTALVLFLPLFLMIAVAIKMDSPGPVLFRQRRCGFNGIRFKILKFRTMSVMEDGEGVVAAQRNDSRVTRIGRWLRRTSIDELPQLFNVLQGSMSIVGPRPHALAHDNEFEKLVGNYAVRHHVKPGMTGWAQVNGCRGEMRKVADIKQRVSFDLWYIDNWNIALDLKIMLMTAIEVTRSENAY
jgi:putative colanic acid biosynthesis UDP-glucose lipid carrier transferase